MKRSYALTILVLLIGLHTAYAQQVKNCATVEQDIINRAKYPQMGTLEDFENALQNKIVELEARRRAGRTQETTITIPVVVHVVHVGEAVGTGLNISQAQVQSQIDVLNEDYNRAAGSRGGSSSDPRAAAIGIEFCLSPVDENGVAMDEPGIDRVRGNNATWTKEQIEGTLKPQTIWNPNLFFNIWTVKFGGADNLLLGYAQFPDQSGLAGLDEKGGSAATDGVVVQYSSFGCAEKGTFPVMTAPYNLGRTLSHETGHWLGLRHIWGDGPCGNDYVSDTPQQHSENRGCPASKLSCDNVSVEMPQNYMDYSDDACMNIFTNGQKARILAVIEVSPRRKQLVEANLCNANVNAPPVAAFTSDRQNVLLGGKAVFTDLSSNFPKSWSWTFEGGDPATSTIKNPTVTYSVPGSYTVTLVSKNSLGKSDSLVMEGFINVSEEGLCSSVNNFKPEYTPSVIKLSEFGDYTGYLTGQNSAKSLAMSESFINPQGYKYISGVNIKFGKVIASSEDATVTVIVWNARGVQNGPGSVIERKTVLLKQIVEDIQNDQATAISFERETPVFSLPYHVGIELTYGADTVAVESSANGEANNATSWIEGADGVWQRYSIAYGANIAMNIQPVVGMNPSVQVGASKLLINPGEEVTLIARGANVFVWNASDNSVTNVPGPQLIVRPTETTVYETTGSGLDLCNSLTETTIYVREGEITGLTEKLTSGVSVFPNPGNSSLNISFENGYRGPVQIRLMSMLNQPVQAIDAIKSNERFETKIDAGSIPAGVYITSVKIGETTVYRKWIKQ